MSGVLQKLQGKREPSQTAVKGYLAILKYMGDYPCRRISTVTKLTDEVFKGAFKYVRFSFLSSEIERFFEAVKHSIVGSVISFTGNHPRRSVLSTDEAVNVELQSGEFGAWMGADMVMHRDIPSESVTLQRSGIVFLYQTTSVGTALSRQTSKNPTVHSIQF